MPHVLPEIPNKSYMVKTGDAKHAGEVTLH
jgi:hypothetical protein